MDLGLLPLDLAAQLLQDRVPQWARLALLAGGYWWGWRKYRFLLERMARVERQLTAPHMFPLATRRVSGYRFKERTWYAAQHLGVDYAAATGTELRAPFSGTVVKAFSDPLAGGLTVWFQSDAGQRMRFLHLSKFLVPQGTRVFQGQAIALTGNSGALTTGPHLHLDLPATFSGAFWLDVSNFRDPERFDWDPSPVPFEAHAEPEQVGSDPRFRKVYDGFLTDLAPSQEFREEAGRVQDYLVDRGFMDPRSLVDEAGNSMRGYYGRRTQEAVDRFQKAAQPGPPVTGATEFGWWYPMTRDKANRNLGIDAKQPN